MQWSADKNAGFSRANPQSLYLPINLDPENHYEAVNVEVQERNPHSLLWWMRRLIGLYKSWQGLGLGTLELLHPENRKVFACVRRYRGEALLVVANLSRFVQPVELELGALASRVPVELFGGTEFPAITGRPYFLTLGPHTFYWFSLQAKAPAPMELVGAPVGAEVSPVLILARRWQEIFHKSNHIALERALQNWLPSRHWFKGRAPRLKRVHVVEIIPVPMESEKAFLTFLQVEYGQAEPEIYLLPLTCAFAEQAENICSNWPALVVARLTLSHSNQDGVLHDAVASKSFCEALFKFISRRRSVEGNAGELGACHTARLRRLRREHALALEPSARKTERSNSSIVYGNRFILKLFRRLEEGINPELEISRFLSGKRFPHTPPLVGALEYRGRKKELTTVGVLAAFVPGCETGWEYSLAALSRFYDHVRTLPTNEVLSARLPQASISQRAGAEFSAPIREMIGTYLESALSLGRTTAAMHMALASDTAEPNFAPEPLMPYSRRGFFQSWHNLTRQNFQLLNQRLNSLDPVTRAQAEQVLELEGEVLERFRAIYERNIEAVRIRVHGNYHLGQVLYTGREFLIIDFEGEPEVALSERRLKRSPLRDVVAMIRSFRYAAHAALLN